MNDKYKYIKYLSYVTQLGLNIVTPVVLCIIISVYIKNKFNIGDIIVVAGIVIGCGAGFMSLINFIKFIEKENSKKE
ncbi:MAG: AtpZ/AtpI family protein [Ruminococcaceae bacterium]|nr:AtpZ/AtpI family protein [Oscillospiraceae bacterium]